MHLQYTFNLILVSTGLIHKKDVAQLAFTCSKSTKETKEQRVKSVQS